MMDSRIMTFDKVNTEKGKWYVGGRPYSSSLMVLLCIFIYPAGLVVIIFIVLVDSDYYLLFLLKDVLKIREN